MSELHHRLEGGVGAPVLVLSCSLGTTLELWDRNLDTLSSHCGVLRYDQRGHGRSAVPPGPYRIEELGGDVLELLDELELDRISFCGISIGGAVGLWLGAAAPDRVDRLVVASSSASFGAPESWLERARTVRAHGVPAISGTVVGRWFTRELETENPELVGRFRRMLESTPAEGYAGCCEAIAEWDFHDRLGDVAVPTLVLAAEDDPATPPAHSRSIADGVPGASLAIIPNAAHLANVEQPEQFSQLVLEHLGVAAHVGRRT